MSGHPDATPTAVYRATRGSRAFYRGSLVLGIVFLLIGPFVTIAEPGLGLALVICGLNAFLGSWATVTEVEIIRDRCSITTVIGRIKEHSLSAVEVRHRRFHGIFPSYYVQGRLNLVDGPGWRRYVLAGPMPGFADLRRHTAVATPAVR